MPSRKQPSTAKNIVSTTSSIIGESCISAIHSARCRGMPVKPIATARNAAPARLNEIMQEVLVAPNRLALKDSQFVEPVTASSSTAQATTQPATQRQEARPNNHQP